MGEDMSGAQTGLGHDPNRQTIRSCPAPGLAVDCIILLDGKVLLIHRRNPPHGWALPGGFVECGETVEDAVRREMKEETGLELAELRQFRVYSDPARDPRGHVVSVVFSARGVGRPEAGDDADRYRLLDLADVPTLQDLGHDANSPEESGHVPRLVFDHAQILRDFVESGKYQVPMTK